MRKLGCGLTALMLLPVASPAPSQEIRVSVQDTDGRPVYSHVWFRRSSSSAWDRLGATGSDGELLASLSCAPGTEIYADPVPGEYWDSPKTACQQALPLRVAPRRRFVLSEALSQAAAAGTEGVSRIEFANALGRVEARQFQLTLGTETALDAYLASSENLAVPVAERIQQNLLNESSAFYAAVDADRNGLLSAPEISVALQQASGEAAAPD